MLTLFIPMLVFTLIVALLAAIVLWVRTGLSVREPVTISVNGQQQLSVQSGDTLLATLAAAGVQLPSACGGRGTCGQCRVVVEQGGGRLLPTETSHINRHDALKGARLACMLKVREDLAVSVPSAVLSASRWECRVRSNISLSTYLTELTLELPADHALSFRAGDYVLVTAPASTIDYGKFEIDAQYRDEWERNDLFRYRVEIAEPTSRAYSMANSPGETGIITLVVRIALPPASAPADTPPGLVSSYIYSLRPGERVTVSGPFGEFHAKDSDREMILIGGGAGIAPLRAIIRDQLLTRHSRRPIHFYYGCRNLREIVYADEFQELMAQFENFHFQATLSRPDPQGDWSGPVGLVHRSVYEHHLKDHPNPEDAEYYLCGPPLMSSAVLAMLEDLGVDRSHVFFDDFGT